MWKKGMFGARRPKPNATRPRVKESGWSKECTREDLAWSYDSGDIGVPDRGDKMSLTSTRQGVTVVTPSLNTYRVRDSDGATHEIKAEEFQINGPIVIFVIGKLVDHPEWVHVFNNPISVVLVDLVNEEGPSE